MYLHMTAANLQIIFKTTARYIVWGMSFQLVGVMDSFVSVI